MANEIEFVIVVGASLCVMCARCKTVFDDECFKYAAVIWGGGGGGGVLKNRIFTNDEKLTTKTLPHAKTYSHAGTDNSVLLNNCRAWARLSGDDETARRQPCACTPPGGVLCICVLTWNCINYWELQIVSVSVTNSLRFAKLYLHQSSTIHEGGFIEKPIINSCRGNICRRCLRNYSSELYVSTPEDTHARAHGAWSVQMCYCTTVPSYSKAMPRCSCNHQQK